MHRLKTFLASILPGIFLMGYNIGTGSITSMSKAGANFGLDLLWTILLSCVITYYLIDLFSRYTMATGETVIQGIKHHIHPWIAILLVVALSGIIVSALMGLLGIVAEVLHVWSKTTFHTNIPIRTFAIVGAALLYVLVWFGKYAHFEKILAGLVAVMGIAFFASALINFPGFPELAQGFIPSIPETAEGSDSSPWIIVASMVGTTVSVFAFLIRSQIVQERGWRMADIQLQRRDAAISATMMFLLSAAVMITAASTLHVQGLQMNSVSEMIPLLEPIAGPFALVVFVIGIVAAGISSHLPNLLMIPWLVIDYRETPRDTRTTGNRLLLLALSIGSVAGAAFGLKPIFVMLLSQAFIAIVLPVTVACLWYLSSRSSLMKTHTIRSWENVVLLLILGFACYMSALGIKGFLADL